MTELRYNRYFNVAWWAHMVGFAAVGVLPMFIPWHDWHWVGLLLLVTFLFVEYVSKGARHEGQYSTTLTAWVFWKLERHKVARILLGAAIALVAWGRLPEWGVWWLTFNRVVGVFLLAWLPLHYSERGFRGVVEDFMYNVFGVRLW